MVCDVIDDNSFVQKYSTSILVDFTTLFEYLESFLIKPYSYFIMRESHTYYS